VVVMTVAVVVGLFGRLLDNGRLTRRSNGKVATP
jgi:hypothetical protein